MIGRQGPQNPHKKTQPPRTVMIGQYLQLTKSKPSLFKETEISTMYELTYQYFSLQN